MFLVTSLQPRSLLSALCSPPTSTSPAPVCPGSWSVQSVRMAACNQACSRAEDQLPPEMLDKIFSLLPPRDLRMTGQVCRRWRQVGEVQHNWVRVLLLVFSLLAPRDLKTVVQVCRRWRQVGETPRLWAWAKIWVNRENMAVMPEILGSRRLQGVKEFIADRCQISEEVVKARVGNILTMWFDFFLILPKLCMYLENRGDLIKNIYLISEKKSEKIKEDFFYLHPQIFPVLQGFYRYC